MDASESFLDAPHPYLKEPVLYVADVPDRVKWGQLEKRLSSCGRVRSEGRIPAPGTTNKMVKVVFSSVFYGKCRDHSLRQLLTLRMGSGNGSGNAIWCTYKGDHPDMAYVFVPFIFIRRYIAHRSSSPHVYSKQRN